MASWPDIIYPLCFLCSDVEKIRAGIGDKLSIFIQWIATFVTGFVIAFVRSWRFTLLLLAFTPFLVITGAVLSKVREDAYERMVHRLLTLLHELTPADSPSLSCAHTHTHTHTHTVGSFIYKQGTKTVCGCRGRGRGSAFLNPNRGCFWRRRQGDSTVSCGGPVQWMVASSLIHGSRDVSPCTGTTTS